jgi:hypothetical protein
MKLLCGVTISFVLGTVLIAPSATAQLAGNPVYAALPSVGITLSGDYGRGLVTDESSKTDYFGGRLDLGLSALSIWVGGGAYDSKVAGADMEIAFGGGVAAFLLGARSSPVILSVQAGGGTVPCGTDCTTINAFAGPVLKANTGSAVDIVHPWIMPRVHVTRFSMSDASVNQVGFGGSAGFSIDLPFGLGLHGAIDFTVFEETSSGAIVAEERSPLIVGGGLHYSVSIPGLGVF